MSWTELHHTLTALVTALDPPEATGLIVDRADLTVPLEAKVTRDQAGGLTLFGRVPHSRWRSGFITTTSPSRLVVTATGEQGDPS